MQYPPQTGFYKVKTKGSSEWQAHSTACLDISVGQDYHEGEKFLATCEWVGARFEHIIISVNDTLQRWNVMYEHGISEQDAHILCLKEGLAWVERNKHCLKTLPSLEIRHWDEYKQSGEYTDRHDRVKRYYAGSSEFQTALHEMIDHIWNRRTKIYDMAEKENFVKHSREYLFEEMAVFMGMDKNTHHVYPGTFLDLAKTFGHISYTRIDFSRNHSHPENQKAA